MNTPTIQFDGLRFDYGNQCLFDQLSLSLSPGKLTCLLGASGSGKSTLLKLIAGLIPALKQQPSEHIAYMAQSDLLLPWLNALDNALLGIRLREKISAAKLRQAKELFARVGLSDATKKFPAELSGGMRQRVALIRTLLEEKPIVLMDEPFSSVDTLTRWQLQSLTAELLKDRTTLFVTHDPIEALRLADEIYILKGQPATLHLAVKLNTATPRDFSDPDVQQYQSILFDALL